MPDIKTINVVGLGYVGLPSAALMARAGYKVRGVDIDETLIGELHRGECRLGEALVQQIVTDALRHKTLEASTSCAEADAFFICVPTPVTAEKRADLSMVRSAIKSAATVIRKGDLVVLESTSPINTTRGVIAEELEAVGLDPYSDVDVCYCPERVFPGNTVNEILNNDRVVGGLTPRATERAKAFYESFCNGTVTATDATSAEFSKLMENTFRDVNIALANVFARIAEHAGVDVSEVIRTANLHPRVNVHRPGPGVGGHCIPVDPWFLINGFPEATEFLRMARQINDGQARNILDRAKAHGLKPGAKVALLGAAYRGDIDDARETPTELMVQALADDGFSWTTHDPLVETANGHSGLCLNLTKDLGEALRDSSAAFLMTDHSVYRTLSPSDLAPMKDRLVVDTRFLLDPKTFNDSGYRVLRLGAPA